MPSYKGRILNNQCIINVWVNLAESDRDPHKKYRMDEHSFTAIIDTGAQRTCIGRQVIERLNLDPKGKAKMQSASTETYVNQYRVDMFLPITERIPHATEHDNVDVAENVSVKYWASHTVIGLDNDKFECLLGMDMLQTCNVILAHREFILCY